MKKSSVKQSIAKAIAFFALFLGAFNFAARAGGDGFEVYLNNKLIAKQYLTQPLDLKTLALDKANINDQITIYFTQCNAIGKIAKGRSIVVKDEKGRMLKEWKFDDAKDAKPGMVIQVKELLQLENSPGEKSLSLFYRAEGHPDAQIITSLKISGKSA
ncbi:MAG TPA: hypothetical protein VK543_09030 [Puia sp.]|nr:hypothetical protein [Puia sp.]